MPNRRRSTPSPSGRIRAVSADAATGVPILARKHSHHTPRRSRQARGKPFDEVIETMEEGTGTTISANQVPTNAALSSSRQQRCPSSSCRAAQGFPEDSSKRHAGLLYHGNGRTPRMNWGELKSAGGTSYRTPFLGTGAREPANGDISLTDRKGTTPHHIEPVGSATRSRADSRRAPRGRRVVKPPVDISALEDYKTPARRRRADGRYAYDHGVGHTTATVAGHGSRHRRRGPFKGLRAHDSVDVEEAGSSLAEAAHAEPYHFRVRLHECQGVFADLEESGRVPPAFYFAVHTVEERGHSGMADRVSYNPAFHDEFIFSSVDPENDALVCTLVTASSASSSRGSRTRREKKVAECVLALHNLAWQVERKVWVPLVRRPGTLQAYEQGEVLVSIYSDDFGYDDVATEEEEAACSAAIHDILTRYAPQELHRLDWMTAAYVKKSTEALSQLRASYRARTVEPVPVRVTVQRVEGLTDEAGCPTRASGVYVVVGDGRVEQRSETVVYRRRAIINQEFNFILCDPEADTLSVTVFGNSRKLGEAVSGLTNVRAGEAKQVTLMLVRAAATGDASNGGQVTITLQTDKYSSRNQMSAAQEAGLRERVLAYLWCYLRDDLHRLDAIVGSVDDAEAYMQSWARTVGPEQKPRRLIINIREARHMLVKCGLPLRCYARISVGPTTVRTRLATAGNGAVTFSDPFNVQVYDPAQDVVEVMMIADGDDGEREISRVCFGVATLPLKRAVVRTLHLVAAATKRGAHVQGELVVQLVAEDFGLTGAVAEAAAGHTSFASSPHMQRLESIVQRGSPERLHRVPYIIDTAPPGETARVIEEHAKRYGGDVAVAPMTVKILGVKDFKPLADFYVKVYLNSEAILRTADVRAAAEVAMDIDDKNETTIRLRDAPQAVMTFKIAQHRALRKTVVLGETEVALASLVRGEKNVLWLPFFDPSVESMCRCGDGGHRSSASCTSGSSESALKVKGNRMPHSNGTAAARQQPQSRGAALVRRGATATLPVGLLGVELQSNAFPVTFVTEYTLDDESGRKGVSAQEAVTYDVMSLLAKLKPSELPKVQPMIAQCSSLRSAHDELRAELSATPIASTIYVNIDSVELATEAGKRQEAEGGIAVELVYGSERQESRKQAEFAHDALHHRQVYTQIRLDIPEYLHGATRGRNGAISRATADNVHAPALELRLFGVDARVPAGGAVSGSNGGVDWGGAFVEVGGGAHQSEMIDAVSEAAEDSYYVGGENSIYTYIKHPKRGGRLQSTKQLGEERFGNSPKVRMSPQQRLARKQQTLQHKRHPHGTGEWTASSHANLYQGATGVQPGSCFEEGGKHYRVGTNNIRSSVGAPGQTRRQSAARADQAPSREHSGAVSASGRHNQPGSTATSATAISLPHHRMGPYRGEIGVVYLSLRALLTKPLYRIGRTLRVPIVEPAVLATLSDRARCSPEINQRCIVGYVTLRLTLPAFENIPESLHLAPHSIMSKVEPSYVHYYEERISAYLRSHTAPALVSLHYKLYEREVASGCWPASLSYWMQALIERFGPEVDDFGPEPPLPFDVEEWKGVRQRYGALRPGRKATVAPQKQGNKGAGHPPQVNNPPLSSRGASPPAQSRPESMSHETSKDKKKSSREKQRLDAVTTGAELEHSF
ncbi:hypothetical protein LSCM1_00465 [Leishmania martiniquensis]|uniref:C2 domain-containing protein n=1 Tax=Leishmania martiniquensis TaxID=1580590 RepID=A0A836K5Y3_9TRYP|nr:hypothetical protein LSCM1_00465 [Leishmania martiniquensis]